MRLAWRRLAPGELDHELLWGAIGLVLAAAAIAAARLPWLRLPCPFHALTGWPCGTCGGTRAVVALATGDVAEALRMNPLVAVAAMLGAAWMTVSIVTVVGRLPRLRLEAPDPRARLALRVAALAAFLGNWAFLVVAGR